MPVELGHHQIGDDDVGAVLLELGEALLAVLGDGDVVAVAAEHARRAPSGGSPRRRRPGPLPCGGRHAAGHDAGLRRASAPRVAREIARSRTRRRPRPTATPATELGPGRHAGGAGDPRLAADGARPPAGVRPLPEHLGAGRRLHRRAPHPQRPPEPLRRGSALGLLHPGLRAAARRGPAGGRRPGGQRGLRAALGAGGGAGGPGRLRCAVDRRRSWSAASRRPARPRSPRPCS